MDTQIAVKPHYQLSTLLKTKYYIKIFAIHIDSIRYTFRNKHDISSFLTNWRNGAVHTPADSGRQEPTNSNEKELQPTADVVGRRRKTSFGFTMTISVYLHVFERFRLTGRNRPMSAEIGYAVTAALTH